MTAPIVDHCTGWFDAWWGEACCKPHDDAFAAGGTVIDFLRSNLDLGLCVASFGDLVSLLAAPLMAAGTTLFGWIFWRRAARGRTDSDT